MLTDMLWTPCAKQAYCMVLYKRYPRACRANRPRRAPKGRRLRPAQTSVCYLFQVYFNAGSLCTVCFDQVFAKRMGFLKIEGIKGCLQG